MKLQVLLLFLLTPFCILAQDLKNKAPHAVTHIDIKKEGSKEENYRELLEWLLDKDFLIEYRDPELFLIKTEPFQRNGHISSYNFRIKDNEIVMSGVYKRSGGNVAIWGTGLNVRDEFQQIKNVSGVGIKGAFKDMQFVAELIGEDIKFRK